MRVAYAWELGGRGGHLARWRVLGGALRERGHDVRPALREGPATPGRDAAWRGRVRSVADVLLKTVWRPGLAGRVDAWRSWLDEADVLVADYALTAVLAARAMGLPAVTVGTGFSRCPDAAWSADLGRLAGLALPADDRIDARAAEALRRVRGVLPDIGSLADVYAGVADLRCGFATLDPFATLFAADEGEWLGTLAPPNYPRPTWPAGDGPRVLMYAGTGPAARSAAAGLGMGGGRVIDLAALPAPVHLPTAAAEADVTLCAANYGVVAASLLAGTPLVLVPADVEKGLIARRVLTLGAGRVVDGRKPHAIASGVRDVLADSRHTDAARAFARGHSHHDPAAVLTRVTDTIARAGRPA